MESVMNKQWNICAVQMNIRIGDPERNKNEVIHQIELAMQAEQKPDVIVLPEMWNTGYAWDRIHELADPDGQDTIQLLREMSAYYQVNVAGGSTAVYEDGHLWNRSYVFNRNGELIHTYNKVHLFQLMDEHHFMKAGHQLGIFELDGVRCGIVICYDIRFPEWIRTIALQGIDVLFVPAQWPENRVQHWQALLTARAIENQIAVIACNRMGASIAADGQVTKFAGHSLMIDAWGQVIAAANEQEQHVIGVMDLSHPYRVREQIPILQDRRPELYQC